MNTKLLLLLIVAPFLGMRETQYMEHQFLFFAEEIQVIRNNFVVTVDVRVQSVVRCYSKEVFVYLKLC